MQLSWIHRVSPLAQWLALRLQNSWYTGLAKSQGSSQDRHRWPPGLVRIGQTVRRHWCPSARHAVPSQCLHIMHATRQPAHWFMPSSKNEWNQWRLLPIIKEPSSWCPISAHIRAHLLKAPTLPPHQTSSYFDRVTDSTHTKSENVAKSVDILGSIRRDR